MQITAKWQSLRLFILGGLGTLAFAPFSQGWLVFILLPILFYTCFKASCKQAALYSFSFALGWFSIGLSWIHVSLYEHGGVPIIGSVAMILLLAAYLAIYFTAAITSTRYLMRYSPYAILLLPALWSFFEWLRSFILTGFPWLSVGYSQIDTIWGQLAAYVGETGVSLIVISLCLLPVAGLTLKSMNKKQVLMYFVPLILLTAVSNYILTNNSNTQKTTAVAAADKQEVKLTLVQGNIAQENRWQPEYLWPTMLKYQDISRPYYSQSDILIWPEAAIPAIEPNAQEFLTNLDKATNYNNTALVTGIIDYRPYSGAFFNSLIVLGQQGSEAGDAQYFHGHENRYNKHHLLPIGEFVPFEQWLRELSPIFDLPFSSFTRGEYIQHDIVAKGFHITPAICYEILFPHQVRDNLTDKTDFILTVSNDAWFGRSHGPHQHLEIARMRALELGIPVVRATNTGISAIIDGKGKIIAQAPQFEQHILTHKLAIIQHPTIYKQFGDWLVYLCYLLSLIAVVGHATKRKNCQQVTEQP
ncbi:apolipoprotein N-acyltransferase [Catenovulum agarivorans DS-2]|uniref:Apolipoprotein N-acyltransferase n=1 Tax=Catenovulum agarivorans DS-2 TaxID=1328313 RepID=W7QGX2_9ALTE|nr:apolipoprotein N-acyltransferase [Catenovulum agarivorans]EWH08187.1 apolipoprotein N-acyltransferase [Catenovulum agarivorans DS-2]